MQTSEPKLFGVDAQSHSAQNSIQGLITGPAKPSAQVAPVQILRPQPVKQVSCDSLLFKRSATEARNQFQDFLILMTSYV